MDKKIYICEKCGKEHDGKYGSGRFCSEICSRSFSSSFVSKEGRKRQRKALNDPDNRKKARINLNKTIKKKKEERQQLKIVKQKPKSKFRYENKMKKGKLGEHATIKKCIENNINVYLPIIDDGIDMIFDINGNFKKVQVKSASSLSGVENKSIAFKLVRRKQKIRNSKVEMKDQNYSKEEIDLFSLYDLVHDDVYLIENDGESKSVVISRSSYNNKKSHNYEDYKFENVIEQLKTGHSMNDIIDIE